MSIQVKALTSPQEAFGGFDNTQKVERVYFQATLSNTGTAYPGAPGDTLDFTQIGEPIKSGAAPIFVSAIQSVNPAGSSGYIYNYIPNAAPTQANGKLQVLTTPNGGGALVDFGAQNYNAAQLADTLVGYADFLRV